MLSAKVSARSAVSAAEISCTALDARLVGVWSCAIRRALASFMLIVHSSDYRCDKWSEGQADMTAALMYAICPNVYRAILPVSRESLLKIAQIAAASWSEWALEPWP